MLISNKSPKLSFQMLSITGLEVGIKARKREDLGVAQILPVHVSSLVCAASRGTAAPLPSDAQSLVPCCQGERSCQVLTAGEGQDQGTEAGG